MPQNPVVVKPPPLLQIPRGKWWQNWRELIPLAAPVLKFLLLGTAIVVGRFVLIYGLQFFVGAWLIWIALKAHKG